MRYLLFALLLTSCSTTHYFSDSEKVLADKAGQGICKNYKYDCVVLSQGSLRDLTTINYSSKLIEIVDCSACGCDK